MKNRLFAISDLHGNKNGAIRALQKAEIIDADLNWCARTAILVSLGDSIDRGQDSAGVIDLLLKIKKQAALVGGKVILLMGNHCKMLLDARKNGGWRDCWLQNGGFACIESYPEVLKDCVDDNGMINYFDERIPNLIYKHHKEYFDSLEQFVIIGDNLFVHAGVHPQGDLDSLKGNRQNDVNGPSHLWIRDQFYNYHNPNFLKNYGVKRVIVGHTPTQYALKNQKNEKMVPIEKLYGKILMVDCGSYYGNGGVCVVELTDDSYRIAGIEYNV